MSERMVVLDPTAASVAGHATLAPRPPALDGLIIGVLDNGKPNSDRLLGLLVEQLRHSYNLAEVVTARKPNIGRLAPTDIVDQLLARCDAIITGVGDCAGCASCSAHDGVTFERRGVPAAVVCTAEFLVASQVAAESAGLPGYQFAVTDHPLGSLDDAQLAARAKQALWQVEGLLLTGGGGCAC